VIRNLKTLGLALVAVFAMSAVAASAAHATAASFSWDSGTTRLTGTAAPIAEGGTQKFTITAGALSTSCDTVYATAEVSGTSASSITTIGSPTYTNTVEEKAGEKHTCTNNVGGKVTVSTTNCNYRFNAGTTVTAGTSSGTVDIVCPAGSEGITVNSPGLCLIHIFAQNGLGPVNYNTMSGPPEDVTIEPLVNNITYTHTGLCGNATKADGTYTGQVTVKGENASGAQTNATVT